MSGIWSSPSKNLNFACRTESNHTFFPPSFHGQTVTSFLEWLTPSSLASLKPYTSTLSVLLNEQGGIIDDTIITKHAADAFYVVTNAGRRERDLSWFREKLDEWNSSATGKQGPVELQVLENWGLLALQGKSWLLYYQDAASHTSYSRSRSSIVFTDINILRPSTADLWKLGFRTDRRI
jgi:Aminomethyltransferase folate-binding domain